MKQRNHLLVASGKQQQKQSHLHNQRLTLHPQMFGLTQLDGDGIMWSGV
jgi:hypothetical protein